jgi:hypothetical protein
VTLFSLFVLFVGAMLGLDADGGVWRFVVRIRRRRTQVPKARLAACKGVLEAATGFGVGGLRLVAWGAAVRLTASYVLFYSANDVLTLREIYSGCRHRHGFRTNA